MKLAVLLPISIGISFAAIGDNAPSLPATYVTTQPRLPYPDNTYLDLIWNNRAGATAFIWMDSTNWSSTTPGNRIQMRHLLFAYLAEKRNGGPNVATFLQKIKDFSNLSGNWNLTTGGGYWDPTLALSLALDWANADLGSAVQSSICSSLDTMMTNFEVTYVSSKSSPYNDQFYITGFRQMLHLLAALASYPNCGGNALKHLRWSLDMHVNMLWPAWKEEIGSAGYCAASTDSSTDCGGAWHEAWGDYVNKTEGLTEWFITEPLAWSVSSGRGVSNYFAVDNPWMKNLAYWTMYQVRPDFTLEPVEPMGRPHFDGENFSATGYPLDAGHDLSMLDGLAAIYNDPTIRGWSRLINWYGHIPNGFVPSSWPYYVPDSSANNGAANSRSALSTVRNFPGAGRLYVRTGWGENDTSCVFVYRDSYWSHPVQDAGALNCFNRGPLTIRSGDYRPGSASDHFQNYALQAIAQNTLVVCDPADVYASETLPVDHNDGTETGVAMPNDCGQRRVGSAISNKGGLSLNAITASPSDPAQRSRGREFYHMAKLIAYANGTGNKYTYAAVDMTNAYNNQWSRRAHSSSWLYNEANTSNRTFRVQKAVRQVTFIPRGTAMYVITYDQVTATNASFTKKVLWHSINQPAISANSYTITRADLVTSKPFVDHWPQQWSTVHVGSAGISNCPSGCTTSSTQYQYHGKLYGWMTLPASGSLTLVGGVGHEFDITDPGGAGTINHNECMQNQCMAGEGLGAVAGQINPEPLAAPHQPGSWRIEEWTGPAGTNANNFNDSYINVQLVTSDLDTNTVSTAPSTSASGTNWMTTWKDNSDTCTYTLTQPQNGAGGTIAVQGAGCTTIIN
ncbi:MAG TPA: hypothetical protein VNH83_01570 [Bryobacteraceae bacterium]|nr:hypothetical protein [Bryobacteraceae bacterium]